MLDSTIETVLDSYLETALWSSVQYADCEENDTGEHFDADYDIHDFTESARSAARADCAKFLEALQNTSCPYLSEYDNLYDAADDLQGNGHIGHDFFLTRNGHGAGFWDGDYTDRETGIEYGDLICDVLHAVFGEYSDIHLWSTDDGCVDFD